jgi:hypothetical protein
VQAVAQLVGRDLDLGAALAGDDHAGRRDAGQAREAQQLPGDAHRRLLYGR